MEDRRTQGNGRDAQRFRLFSFLLQTGQGHPGPGLVLVIYKEASPRDPGATSHHPRDLLSSDVEFNFPPPIINHTTRTMTGR